MSRPVSRLHRAELLILFTAVGLAATFAAPWLELQGTFQSWRLVEWHTFWRGPDSFLLAGMVAANYAVPVEFATQDMQALVRTVAVAGTGLGLWHILALVVLLAAGLRLRNRSRVPAWRPVLEMVALVLFNLVLLSALSTLLAWPSSISLKVDFRSPADVHSDSLIWSQVNWMPLAPVFSAMAALAEVAVVVYSRLDLAHGNQAQY